MESSPQSDAAILEQMASIRQEAEASPLVGPKIGLDSLKAYYATNPGFLRKIEKLMTRFASMRSTRPDGSCFYRAYTFGLLELASARPELLPKLLTRIRKSWELCRQAGYEPVAVEDYYEEYLKCAERVGPPSETDAQGEQATPLQLFEEYDIDLIIWSRVMTGSFMKAHEEDFSAFLTSHASVSQFCAQEVDPVAKDADHLQITALTRCLGVPAVVVYLDQSEGDEATEHRFDVESPSDGAEAPNWPPVYLLYRPGHYDLIYPED